MKKQLMYIMASISLMTITPLASAQTCGGEIHFKKGASSTILSGKVKGYDLCEYTFRAKKGQVIEVQHSENQKPYAFLYDPVEQPLANHDPFVLPQDGQYTLRVGMTRNDARKYKDPQSFDIQFSIQNKNTQTQPCGGEIVFPKGSSHATLKGSVQSNDLCEYTFTAKKGQVIEVQHSENQKPYAFLYDPVEQELANHDPFVLPQDGQYTLRVGMTRNDARKYKDPQSFDIQFSIQNKSTQTQPCGGEIVFPNGSSHATLKGSVQSNDLCEYTFRAKKGQVIEVQHSENQKPYAFLYDPVEQPLANHDPFVLPQDGQYTLRVGMTRNDARKYKDPQSFDIQFSIEDAISNSPNTQLIGQYQGALPNALCNDANTNLNLQENGTYTLSQELMCLAKEPIHIQIEGQWHADQQIITLMPYKKEAKTLYLFLQKRLYTSFLKKRQKSHNLISIFFIN